MNKRLSDPMTESTTLVELLRWRALHQPDQRAYTFLVDGETEEGHLTYQELDRQARAIAARLQHLGAVGERALLLYPPGLEYIAGFFGCLYAGAIAVPAYPPDPTRLNRTLPRLQAIVNDARPLVILTTSPILAMAEALLAQDSDFQSIRWLATDGVASDSSAGPSTGSGQGSGQALAEEWEDSALGGDTLAFLQYTSGSTAAPKGVMLTHDNLLHNSALIHECFGHTPDGQGVIWLPPYHDMGLIGGIIQPLYGGFPVTLMSPIDFLKRPFRWLQAISRYEATTSGGPSFAYDLCVRKVAPEQRATLDLSSWDLAFNGAEPVRHETMERFAEAFEPCGFRKEAFYPCYGLAEATLIASGGLKSEPPVVQTADGAALGQNRVEAVASTHADAQILVGCGHTLTDQQIVIVDPGTFHQCAPSQIGEIWVSGPSVAQGYWNRPEATAETFQAYLADTGEGPFLRTGDLGFLQDGELFIAGRLKDLIIIRGRNHYPQDIERTVEQSHPLLRPGCCAAFSVQVAGEERLVVAQEVRRQATDLDLNEVVQTVRQAVAEEHELQVYSVVLLQARTIPKTSSGKIQRHACRAGFLSESLDVVAKSILDEDVLSADAPAGEPGESFICKALMAVSEPVARHSLLALYLQEQVARVLHLPSSQVGPRQPLGALGLDSLMAVDLTHEVETSLGVALPMADLLQGPSISELASKILAKFEESPATAPARIVPLQEPTTEHALSHGQRAMWFLHQLAPESAAYNITNAVRIRGEMNVSALQRAFQKLVDRHSSLRTTFSASHGEPVQRVHEQVEVCFWEEDASTWSEASLGERLAEEANRPFNLEHGPLMRIHLFSRSAQEHILLLVVHHIVADLWSLAVLVGELSVLYPAECAGKQVTLSPHKFQYADYVRCQAAMLEGPRGEQLQAYWQERLAGELPVLNLPTERPRPAVQTYRGASQTLRLSSELTESLKTLGRAHGATLYMTLLAAFHVLLHRYTGQRDILVGSPTSGRNLAELTGLVGYFVNPIVLRTDLSGNPPFVVFLDRVRQIVLEAFAHQDCPFDLLVEQLRPDRDPSRSPIFQAMFVLQQGPLSERKGEVASFALGETGARMDLEGLSLESIRLDQQGAQFDLTLVVAEMTGGLGVSLQYNTDLFDGVTITRMLGHFLTLLESVTVNPSRRLSDLPLLTEVERYQLVVEWNDTGAEYPEGVCIHELCEAQVERTPDAVAVVFGEQHLTYQELNRRANRLAHYLRRLGVEPEVLVGICVERTLEMVVGLLGILKAGGAYVPLDPAYPRERLAFMLEDARAPVLLTEQKLIEQLPVHGVQVVCLDTDWETIVQARGENPTGSTRPENIAYVIYTSGSTGDPKGVAIEHRGTVTFINWGREQFSSRLLNSTLASTSICFDLSVFELFVPLSCGGTVILVESLLHLPALPNAEAVTLVNTVPSAMRELVSMKSIPASVRVVNLAGEPLQTHLVQQIYQQETVEQVYDLYGPSEDTTYSTYALRSSVGPATIGRPIANTQVYLLDAYLNPVPVSVPGELYIGGAGLARGYFDRPDSTAEKFVPDPFSEAVGARLYKTGDLARYLPDGNIEFLGRIDHQVKIRGYRIELGEIEVVLGQHPGVRETVVAAREDEPGDPSSPPGASKRLVAYVVLDEESPPSERELGRFLREKLPEYMVPSTFVILEALPLTPIGKVDRRALPAPEGIRPELEGAFVAPRTPEEEVLAGIWADVLGLEQVGIHDNFFELGGHSLLATQVVSRVRDAFQVELPLRALFGTPTIAGLVERIETSHCSEQKKSLPPIAPVARDGELSLSFAQQRLWFLDQLEPGNSSYNIPAAMRLTGQLNVAALEWSLNEVVRRHDVLRTTFARVEGQPSQRIASSLTLTVPVVDLQMLPLADRRARTRQLAAEEARRPFDLARGPLLRVILLKLSEREHVVLMNTHHIVSDGWSVGVFIREMTELYATFSANRPSPLSELSVQYVDFAVWQREWLQGEVLDAQLSYWKKRLSDATFVLELPTDRPRLPVQSFRGARQPLVLSESLASVLKTLSQREGVTLFMTLVAAFKVLLYRYTGQEDILVGLPIANRNRSEIEELIGFFVNTLVLRTDLSGNPTFCELLHRVREVTLGAYAHQDLPFELLVEELQPKRDQSRSPLFQVIFVFQNTPVEALRLPGLDSSQLEVDSGTAKFDLTLSVEETERGLKGVVEYNVDLFDAATAARMVRHLQALLEGIVADPEQRISELPLLTEAERYRVLVEWNDTRTEYPKDARVHELFEAQVERTPEAVAVVFGDGYLTYGELNRRAGQLAHYLGKLGVGPEVLVGICVERTLEMVVGILGVLKAGGAYVPLDPAYPRERLDFILSDSQASVLLTQQQLVERLPEHRAQVVCLDMDWETVVQASKEGFGRRGGAENLAYVIYTSGSTGKPKGVGIEHHSTVALIDWGRERFDGGILGGALASTSICFDLSIFELFVPLSCGGTVILVESLLHLPALPNAEAVTLVNTVPSAMRELVSMKSIPASVRVVNLAGEPLQTHLVQQIYQQETVEQVYDLYGPSEDTTYSTYAPRSAMGPATIGRPIANTQVYLLDAHLNPVPVGVLGELYIGGAGVARGYFDRPDSTAERFIPNPFPPSSPLIEGEERGGARLYKTGDLARYLPDGNIEFLGRSDHQVKIRGYRIELGEIEVVLGQHPGVRETVVAAREDEPGDPSSPPGASKRLVAYVVLDEESPPSERELGRFLREKLPEYMVPSMFVILEALPLTPNGKVDRRALPAPDGMRPELAGAFVAPRTPTEEMLAGIWAQVLDIEQVGVSDNFFELGGHSLLATQVISRMREAFQIELPLRALFEASTVAGLAERMEMARRAGQGLSASPMVPVPRDVELPLSFAQQRLWFMDQLMPDNPAYNVPNATRLMGPLDVAALMQTLDEIVRRHETLRTAFVAVDGRPFQVIAPALTVPLPVVDLSPLPEIEREAEAQRLATEEAWRPFGLEQGPLLRATLLRMDVKKHVLLLTMHHIVSDGWSIGVLIQEVGMLYQAFAAREPSPLSELPIQYADFAVWQREWLRGEVLEEQLSYWKEQLDGMPELLELPTDRPRPPTPTFRGAGETLELSITLTEALKILSQREGVTLFMTLLAAFQTLLYRYTGQEDTVVGSSIANRNRSEIKGLIGFFVNTLVLRTDLSGNPTFRELLGRVREVTLDAYAHQDLPFEMLVEELRPKRDTSYNPLCQVVFVFQNAPMPELELPELTLSGLDLDSRKSSFDLILSMRDTEQGLLGTLEYNTHLFDAVTITRMLNHFKVMLEEIAACPEQLLLDIPLSGDEPSRLVKDASSLRAKESAQFDFQL